eukprot:ANDGO_06825.mRNA.1 Ethanolamine-phosphate cytidylyltransferase
MTEQMEHIVIVDRESDPGTKKPSRIYLDGCYDVMHVGHFNAIRQAKKHGDVLVCGIHTNAAITPVKGEPVNTDRERLEMVKSVRWCDEIAWAVPYTVTFEVVERFNIDWVAHGEDLAVNEHGEDSYKRIRDAGKFKLIKRTEGISTTDLINRMLRLSENRAHETENNSRLNATVRKIAQFSGERRSAKKGDRIVYVQGAFDLYHAGHCDFLKRARALGDYLIVGLVSDKQVGEQKGSKAFPVLGWHERVLSILSNRHVDDIVFDVPTVIDSAFLESIKADVVVRGVVSDRGNAESRSKKYHAAEQKGILVTVDADFPELTTTTLIRRILDNYSRFEERNRNKLNKEKRAAELCAQFGFQVEVPEEL